MMTEEEAIKECEALIEMFGVDLLPNPEQEPKRFKMFVKMYKYIKEQRVKNDVATTKK